MFSLGDSGFAVLRNNKVAHWQPSQQHCVLFCFRYTLMSTLTRSSQSSIVRGSCPRSPSLCAALMWRTVSMCLSGLVAGHFAYGSLTDLPKHADAVSLPLQESDVVVLMTDVRAHLGSAHGRMLTLTSVCRASLTTSSQKKCWLFKPCTSLPPSGKSTATSWPSRDSPKH